MWWKRPPRIEGENGGGVVSGDTTSQSFRSSPLANWSSGSFPPYCFICHSILRTRVHRKPFQATLRLVCHLERLGRKFTTTIRVPPRTTVSRGRKTPKVVVVAVQRHSTRLVFGPVCQLCEIDCSLGDCKNGRQAFSTRARNKKKRKQPYIKP